jgi:hypothetical protein
MDISEVTKMSNLVRALNSEARLNERLRQLINSLQCLETRRRKENLALSLLARKPLREYRVPFRKREPETPGALSILEVKKLDLLSPAGLSSLPDFRLLWRRVLRDYYALSRSPLGEQAALAVRLHATGQIGRLGKCGWCHSFFWGRREKVFCKDACRAMYSKASHPDEEKRARHRRYLEETGIPDCRKRIEKLNADPLRNANRISRWEQKLRSYRKELEQLKQI